MSLKVCSICKIEKPTTEFNKNKRKSDGLQTHCKLCSKERFKSYYDSNREEHKKVVTGRKKETIKINQQYVFDLLKQSCCIDCSESDPLVLEFDHVRGKKKRAVSSMIARGCSLETILSEIAKCEVRCANCHRRKTAKQLNYYRNIDMGL